MIEQVILEAAFQMFQDYIRVPDRAEAERRWRRMPERSRDYWIKSATISHRVFELFTRNAA